MSKIKALLEKDMIERPEIYDGSADYELWMQSRKKKTKPTNKKTKKKKYNVKRKKNSKI